MKRTQLTDEQLGKIIGLRKTGANWTQIQRETGILRLIAKREYDNWEASQCMGDLGEARRTVATEAFRDHVNSMIALAEALTHYLRLPTVKDSDVTGDKFLDKFWETNVMSTITSPGISRNGLKNDPEQNRRQNQILSKALITHTKNAVPWQMLEKWKSGWDQVVAAQEKLRLCALNMVKDSLTKEESETPSLAQNIVKRSVYFHPLERMADAIVEQIIRKTETTGSHIELPVTRIRSDGDASHIMCAGTNVVVLKFNDASLAVLANRICNNVAKGLLVKQAQSLLTLNSEIQTMKQIKRELIETLEPLVIRPAILRTRCELCPA